MKKNIVTLFCCVVVAFFLVGCEVGDAIKSDIQKIIIGGKYNANDYMYVNSGDVHVYYDNKVPAPVAHRLATGFQRELEIYHTIDIIVTKTHDNRYYRLVFFSNETNAGFIQRLAWESMADDVARIMQDNVVLVFETKRGQHIYTAGPTDFIF